MAIVEQVDVAARIEIPTGWLELEDEAGGYWLHAECFGERSITHRKTEISGEWTEGEHVIRSVRGNVTETLAVWVSGPTPYVFTQRVNALTTALDQLAYLMIVRFSDSQETWRCRTADYTISTDAPMRAAVLGLVRAQVPRLPAVVHEQVTP